MARVLLRDATFGALAVIDPSDGLPGISRIALAPTKTGQPMSLISDLAAHARALQACPDCALLLGEPGVKGDPLTHPRISLKARAHFLRHGEAGYDELAAQYLAQRPKAKLYIGFGDFSIVMFEPVSAFLNGGFGKAFDLTAGDLLD